MPTFIDMFEDPSTMPTLTKGMLAISDFLTQRWYIMPVSYTHLFKRLLKLFYNILIQNQNC